jgi:hypothetical protein
MVAVSFQDPQEENCRDGLGGLLCYYYRGAA